jgi:hypothetical protein
MTAARLAWPIRSAPIVWVINEARMAMEDRDLLAGEALVLLLPVVVNEIVLLPDELREIESEVVGRDPRIARIARVVEVLRGLNEVLRGQAPAVHARTACGALLDHHRALPELLRAQRRRKRRGAGAEDDEVVV